MDGLECCWNDDEKGGRFEIPRIEIVGFRALRGRDNIFCCFFGPGQPKCAQMNPAGRGVGTRTRCRIGPDGDAGEGHLTFRRAKAVKYTSPLRTDLG